MINSIDSFFNRRPTKTYNCLDFVREVWQAWTGEDIAAKLTRLTGDFTHRRVSVSGVRGFTRLQTPSSPCIVVMRRRQCVPHVGLYLEGRILHLHSRGVEYQPLVVAREYFKEIRYYK